ncbi:hypothetical protein ACSV9I_20780 [Rhizobium sp. G187]|uniref:hypothetical protein n=1 Tax=Rhizobium sp. G187 TaxID=3451352 RepID=UPI003EE6EBFC
MVTSEVAARMVLTVMTAAFFAGLALDIAIPAVVLTAMAAFRWTLENWPLANDSPAIGEARAL